MTTPGLDDEYENQVVFTTLERVPYTPKAPTGIFAKMFRGENPQSIFEVGCKTGQLFMDYIYSGVNPNLKFAGGLDIEPKFIEGIKQNFPMYENNFFVWDANEAPWPMKDKSIDIIFTVGFFSIIKEISPALEEMLRVGKKVLMAEDYSKEEKIVPGDIYECRASRNYPEILEGIGAKCIIKDFDRKSGKTIFLCRK